MKLSIFRASVPAIALVVLLFTAAFAQNDSPRAGLDHFTIGVAGKVSTLGLGADVAVPVASKLNIRAGFNLFGYSRSADRDGVHYDGTLSLRSVDALLDIFPFGGSFHLSPGVLLYNGNHANGTANVPGGQTFTLGGADWLSSPTDPVHGSGHLGVNKAAPMILFGWGNLVPRSSRHFTVGVDLGVAFEGTPKTTLAFAGTACDPSGAVCRNAATDPTFQSSVQGEQTKLNHDLSALKFYPVVQLTIGYKF
jgi:hypothetical protein